LSLFRTHLHLSIRKSSRKSWGVFDIAWMRNVHVLVSPRIQISSAAEMKSVCNKQQPWFLRYVLEIINTSMNP
jgi:hypothetical protein